MVQIDQCIHKYEIHNTKLLIIFNVSVFVIMAKIVNTNQDEDFDNPWNIQSIYDLQYFNCPSCFFKKRSKQEIVNHAYEFHPDSIKFLSNLRNNSLEDVTCPWEDNFVDVDNIEFTEIDAEDVDIQGHSSHCSFFSFVNKIQSCDNLD